MSHKRDEAQLEETGRLGYTSIYGELPEFNPQKTSRAAIVPAQRPWETIFNGPSHALPPLTKLCSAFLESLLEKRTTASGWFLINVLEMLLTTECGSCMSFCVLCTLSVKHYIGVPGLEEKHQLCSWIGYRRHSHWAELEESGVELAMIMLFLPKNSWKSCIGEMSRMQKDNGSHHSKGSMWLLKLSLRLHLFGVS